MAVPTPYFYLFGIGSIIILTYFLPRGFIPKVLTKASCIALKWQDTAVQILPVEAKLKSPPQSSLIQEHRAQWIEEKTYELEKRAFFSKQWLPATHTSRFRKPGDYRTFEIAGFSFIVILGKDKTLRAFHNVCRHRAFAITKKECGSTTVLGCRYHGWSYDSRGKLIKAPEFETVPGFNKDMNGLWELKLEIRESIVFVNFDSTEQPEALDLGNTETMLKHWKVEQMKCIGEWKVEGNFNWKMIEFLTMESELEETAWFSMFPPWMRGQSEDVIISHTAIIRKMASGKLLMLKTIPQSSITTTLECTLYARDARTSFRAVEAAKKHVLLEVASLVSRQNKILSRHEASSSEGPLEPPGRDIRVMLEAHIEAETKLGMPINAANRSQSFTKEGKDDDLFCRELEGENSVCGANSGGLLEW